jgi:hypothetical protein
VGSRRDEANEEAEQSEGEAEKQKEFYQVIGTLTGLLSKPRTGESSSSEASQPLQDQHIEGVDPGLLQALDDEIRKELGPYANDKMATIGTRPKWVKEIVSVILTARNVLLLLSALKGNGREERVARGLVECRYCDLRHAQERRRVALGY